MFPYHPVVTTVTEDSLSGVIYFDRAQKYPKLIMNYYDYTIERATTERTIWCCGKKKSLKCKARLITYGSTVKVMNETHLHEPKEYATKECLTAHVVNIVKCWRCK